MKPQKRFLAFFLAVIAVLTLSAQVWAAESKSSTAAERGEGSHAISPRMSCTVVLAESVSKVFVPWAIRPPHPPSPVMKK